MNPSKLASLAAMLATLIAPAAAQENYQAWPLLLSEFPSTGGGGIVIKGYNPVVSGEKCATDFTAVEPNGATYHNTVEFDAVPAQDGVLCTNGRWRARDGSASGTTPFRVFVKDGVKRGSP
jgi:hypothetical protein